MLITPKDRNLVQVAFSGAVIKPLTRFSDVELAGYDYSPDGKLWLFLKVQESRNLVLLTDTTK
ncbi:MAG: hypothetical protein HYX26_03185 [Acidobacteriales bacterium]|nr:hypothetical protein [Terriglobales bacterium]